MTSSRPTHVTSKLVCAVVEPVMVALAAIGVVVTAKSCGSTIAATTWTWPGVVIVRLTVCAAATCTAAGN